jgi:DNA-3-methyladenine glycosylase I
VASSSTAFQSRAHGEKTHVRDYRAIFDGVESTLISVGSRNLSEEQIRARLDKFKELEGRTFTDAEYYWILVRVIFYSGFTAATVSAKLDVIRQHFPDYETVAGYGEDEVDRILSDPKMIKHRPKVQACVDNARTFRSIASEHGSFQAYLDSFSPVESLADLMLLKEELEYRFKWLGRVTTYHFLTDIGLPVLKPDRVICRIFRRLGLIESDEQPLEAVILGRKLAQATGHAIRYIDIVFAAYGQRKSMEFGLERGICLENNPACSLCGVRSYCSDYARNGDFIELPHGEAGAGFYVSQLIDYVRRSGRDYIIQGQQACSLRDHTKPQSLDVWLRKNCTRRKDTKQAVNEVVDALVASGWFRVEQGLLCPDTGHPSKGLRLLDRPDSRLP